jgi:hypothetical protein
MPDLPAYTLEELMQRARDHIRSRVRGADVGFGSDYDIWARIIGTVSFMFQKQADTQVRLLDPRKAFGSFLREYADSMAIGKTLLETSYASQRATGRVIITSSTASQAQTAASVLAHADGTSYTLDSTATTSATAAKTLRSGHRSDRRRIFQGHIGGGFVSAVVGEVYRFTPTSELCAVYGVDNATQTEQYLVDLYNELDADPAIHDTFVQQFGVVGSITASSGGQAGNKDAKDTLTIAAPVGTISATARVLKLSGGRDALSPSEMQEAIRQLQGTRLGTMTLSEIRDIAMEYTYTGASLRECFILPGIRGIGLYTLYPVSHGKPFVNSADLDGLASYVASYLSPVDKVEARASDEIRDGLSVLNIKVSAPFAPDWTAVYGLPVQAASTTTRVNLIAGEVTASQASGLAVNGRVIVACEQSASPFCGYIVERRVTAIGANYIDVDSALPYPPTTSSYVSSGGPLGQAVIDAIYAHHDAQTPALDTAGTKHARYPAPEVTEVSSGAIQRISDIEGVVDIGIVTSGTPTLDVGDILIPRAIQILMRT